MSVRQLIDRHYTEIGELMRNYLYQAQNLDDAALLALMRQHNKDMKELLFHQGRMLDFLAGEKVEPITIEAEAVLIPAFEMNPP